ncbi:MULTISPECIES: hypothetical protein [Streptomyces]|uniref:hypothetical protein n=1 Tax=Streptomyces TaxID=1883 RepID=UPI000F702438|nr:MULTISPECIES: hypothetical protein [unclassified Streptomyces]AZM89613.1 hypothetical protein D1J60_15025 [Streptomyces sp. W1SF4]RSS61075.1 hypothetical protein EF912_07560 [Streptomyces sp. WAC07061]
MTSIDRPEDQGCLRWVLAVPLALLYLPATFFLYGSLVLQPDSGSPYDPMRDDARVNAVLSVGLWFLGLLLTAVPVFHRNLGRWWYAVPFLLASVAYWRWQTV